MAEKLIRSFMHNMTAAFAKVRLKNVMNPMIMLVVAVGIFTMVAMIFCKAEFGWALMILLCFIVIAFLVAYFYFMIKDPGKLQSEEYQITNQYIEMIQKQGVSQQIDLSEIKTIQMTNIKPAINYNGKNKISPEKPVVEEVER